MRVHNKGKIALCVAVLSVIIVVFSLVEFSWAETRIPLDRVIDVLIGRGDPIDARLMKDNIIRVVTALVVGAGLAACGCAMQAVFKNPLASPYILGLSSGASLGAAIGIMVAIPFLPYMVSTPLLSFIFCSGTMFLVYAVSRIGGRSNTETLILTGVAVSSMLTAFVSFLTYIAPSDVMGDIVFWSMGNLGKTDLKELAIISPLIVIGIMVISSYSKELNALMLGDFHAMDLGIDVSKVRLTILIATTLVVAAAVSFVGTIGFVGLIIPHIFRILLGPNNRILIPMSAFGGAAFLLACDYLAHVVLLNSYSVLPVGILTSMVGAPYFIYLLRRRRKEVGWS